MGVTPSSIGLRSGAPIDRDMVRGKGVSRRSRPGRGTAWVSLACATWPIRTNGIDMPIIDDERRRASGRRSLKVLDRDAGGAATLGEYRTLRRRLSEEGSSYREIVDDVRADVARPQLLSSTDLGTSTLVRLAEGSSRGRVRGGKEPCSVALAGALDSRALPMRSLPGPVRDATRRQ